MSMWHEPLARIVRRSARGDGSRRARPRRNAPRTPAPRVTPYRPARSPAREQGRPGAGRLRRREVIATLDAGVRLLVGPASRRSCLHGAKTPWRCGIRRGLTGRPVNPLLMPHRQGVFAPCKHERRDAGPTRRRTPASRVAMTSRLRNLPAPGRPCSRAGERAGRYGVTRGAGVLGALRRGRARREPSPRADRRTIRARGSCHMDIGGVRRYRRPSGLARSRGRRWDPCSWSGRRPREPPAREGLVAACKRRTRFRLDNVEEATVERAPGGVIAARRRKRLPGVPARYTTPRLTAPPADPTGKSTGKGDTRRRAPRLYCWTTPRPRGRS